MYTSDTKRSNYKETLVWSGITAFTIIFAAVYEHFSFGVYSNAMIFMFVFPLALGVLPSLILSLKGWGRLSRSWNDGVIALTLGSMLTGVLEIYGTSSIYTSLFMILGFILLGLGVLQIWCFDRRS